MLSMAAAPDVGLLRHLWLCHRCRKSSASLPRVHQRLLPLFPPVVTGTITW